VVHLSADRRPGSQRTAQAYAIGDLAEAQAYLAHPILGPRLIECAEIVAAQQGRSAEQIFGGIDAIKLRSSMTLLPMPLLIKRSSSKSSISITTVKIRRPRVACNNS
jgi:hypothetical protein